MAQIISEQDIINAICLSQAYHQGTTPDKVLVELTFDDETIEQFGAEVEINGQLFIIDKAEIVGALRAWIKDVLNGNPFSSVIELVLDEEQGIIAKIS